MFKSLGVTFWGAWPVSHFMFLASCSLGRLAKHANCTSHVNKLAESALTPAFLRALYIYIYILYKVFGHVE